MITAFRQIALFLPMCFVFQAPLVGPEYWNLGGIARGAGQELRVAEPHDSGGASEGLSTTAVPAGPERPNVLLIGIETLRADHVGCLGYERETTPALDQLAQGGILCTRTLSTSGWTLPTVISVMTSLHPDVHRTYRHEHRLSQEVTTLAEVLKANGYTTAGFVSNPVIDGRCGLSRGFDLYDDFTVSLDSGLDIFARHEGGASIQHLACTSELVTRAATKWLERDPDEPFFMFTFYFDPHYDYIPPVPFDTAFDPNYQGDIDGRGVNNEPRRSQRPPDRDLRHLLALYDGEIRYTDGCIAELLRAFAASDVLKNTIVVVFGDHGDEFYEHGKTAHDRTLYDEIIRVPLIFRWPGRLPADRRIDTVVSQIDIMPTLLDYLGVSYDGPVQGTSLRPLIEGTAKRLHDTVWAELNTWIHIQAVADERHKLIRNEKDDTWELYDILADPREQINLYEQPSAHEARLAMMAQWKSWKGDNRVLAENLWHGREIETAPLEEKRLLTLRALGYAQ